MPDLVIRSTNVPADFTAQMQMAQAFAGSTLLPAHLRGKPENVLVILDGARALDVPSFWAFQSMYVVEGKLALSAELMRALVMRAGHKFRVVEHTAKNAKVQIVRKDDSDFVFESEFTIEDARQAGLVNKGPWKSYPKAMLLARATSQAVRAHTPDVLFGVVYTPEELGAVVDEDGEPIIDNTGKIVIDGTAEETTVDQHMINRVAETLLAGDLTDAANAYIMAAKLGYVTFVDPTGVTLQDIWVTRLVTAIDDTPDDPQARQEALRSIWKYANGTGVLAQVTDGQGTTISDRINSRRDAPVDLASAVETVQTILDGEIVNKE